MSVKLELEVQHASNLPPESVPGRSRLAEWARSALEGRRESAQLVVRIVDEEESRELNERYRHRGGPTNVLSFPFDHPGMLEPPLLGDVVVCAPLVAREAAAQRKSVEAHWAHLVVHGVLHLIGFDHEEQHDALIMEDLEREILASLGHADPYAPRPAQS